MSDTSFNATPDHCFLECFVYVCLNRTNGRAAQFYKVDKSACLVCVCRQNLNKITWSPSRGPSLDHITYQENSVTVANIVRFDVLASTRHNRLLNVRARRRKYLSKHFGNSFLQRARKSSENRDGVQITNCVNYYLWVTLNILHFKAGVWVSVTFTST